MCSDISDTETRWFALHDLETLDLETLKACQQLDQSLITQGQ
jgi:hypothetical protein